MKGHLKYNLLINKRSIGDSFTLDLVFSSTDFGTIDISGQMFL